MVRKIALSIAVISSIFADDPSAIKDIDSNVIFIGEGKIKKDGTNVNNAQDFLGDETGVQIDENSISIRGVGEDARGLAINDNGVSLTDVAGSFTFDLDMSELESLVVYKGPGSIYSVNGSGGVVQANSKSVFKLSDSVTLGAGSYGYEYFRTNLHHYFDLKDVVDFSYEMKNIDNDFKEHAASQLDRYNFKVGRILNDSASLEFGIKYSDSFEERMQAIYDDGFEQFKNDETVSNDGIWKFNSKENQTKTINSKYTQYFNEDKLIANIYYTTFDKTDYQEGKIKVNNDNYNAGIDLEYGLKRANNDIVFGLTYKQDMTRDNNQYKYEDVTITTTTTPNGITTETINTTAGVRGTTIGDLMSSSDSDNSLIGIYAKDDILINDKLKADISLRVDRVKFDVDNETFWKYQSGKYTSDVGYDRVEQANTLITPRFGLTYALNNSTNIFASVGQGQQSVTDSQLLANMKNDKSTDIKPAKAMNYDTGIRHASDGLIVSLSAYNTITTDEIIEIKPSGSIKYYENAGETNKFGVDFGVKKSIFENYYVGANYSYSHYKYEKYSYDASTDYSGNTMEGIPAHKYALYTGFSNPNKMFRGKLELVGVSSYYTDRANTHKYEGYDMVANATIGWEPKPDHTLTFDVNNIFDKRYATTATFDGTETFYELASPRTVLISYKYQF